LRRSALVLSTLAFALIVAGCNGGNATTAVTGTSGNGPLVDSGIANPRFLRLIRTPPYPPRIKHRVTAADRERASLGGWQEVSAKVKWQNGASTELLMTDGTVMVQDFCTSNWWRLTPSSSGSYINGTWTQAASLPSGYGPIY
jgi:hypothetical protein